MTVLEWNESLVTGIPVVDGQHRRFVELINGVGGAADAGGNAGGAMAPLLDELVAYARLHFAEEEALMSRVGLDARFLVHHHREHERLAQKIVAMRDDFVAGRTGSPQLLSFLSGWLVFHILGEDQAMARQMRARAGGASPEEAYAMGRGDDTHPSRDALNHTLVDAYTRLNERNRDLTSANRRLADHQATLYRQQEDLEALVHARTAALETLAQDLSRARDLAESGSRAKSRFLAIVSHELRTPMNAVSGFTQLLRESGLDESQDALARALELAAERMNRLVARIVDYVGDDAADADEDERITFDLRELLAEACASCRLEARQKGVAFEIAVGDEVPKLARGPAPVLQRILAELADNAVKFTRAGKVSVTVRTAATERRSVVHLLLCVRDTGCGFDERHASRLFLPFAQADDTTDRRHEGLGIGLALARRLADRIGARLQLVPSDGAGSAFALELDLAVGEDAHAMPRPAEPAPARAPVGAPAAVTDVGEWVRRLCALLTSADTSASAFARGAPAAVAAALGDRLAEIVRRTESFDYEGAIAILRQAPLPHQDCATETA